jgi:hypothetical protein
MPYRFGVTDEGLVRVFLTDESPVLNEALEDSIGSRAPRGAPQDGPSTFWLDRALQAVQARIADASDEPFASGNVTYLQVRDGKVEARYDYDYDPPDDDYFDTIDVQEFIQLVQAWRTRVMEASPEADKRFPPPPQAPPMPGR